MFKDELKSLEIESPQEQLYVLLDNGIFCSLPQLEHSFDVSFGFTKSSSHPAYSALYVSSCLNLSQDTSLIENCKYLFFIEDGFKSSKAIQSYSLTNLNVVLCRKSNLWLYTFSCNLANLNLDLYLFDEHFFFFDNCLDLNLHLSNDFLRNLGFSIMELSERTANLSNPKSNPTILLDCLIGGFKSI